MTKARPSPDKVGKYKQSDWDFYESIRDGKTQPAKRLVLYSGSAAPYYNENENGTAGGDGLDILSPTKALVNSANEAENWNDLSYVVLYHTKNWKILFCGDAHDNTWEHVMRNHSEKVKNIDVLIAPHHGRDSSLDFRFLDVLKPKLTLFGNAKSKHLAYDKWANRGLSYITNNQAGDIILDSDQNRNLQVYVSNQTFAEAFTENKPQKTYFSAEHDAWWLGQL